MGVLRLFLALSVLLGHSHGHGFFGLSFLNAGVAVQTFFVISGFYMALVLNEKYNKPGEYWLFISQRFLRLYPTYLILVGIFIILDTAVSTITGHPWGSLANWHNYAHLLSPLKVAYMVVENIIILGQDLLMLLFIDPNNGAFSLLHSPKNPINGDYFLIIPAAWTLALEFSFYLLAPFFVRRSARAQIILFAFCLVIRAAYLYAIPFNAGGWTYFTFPPNLFFFIAGSLAYIVYKKYGNPLKAFAVSKPWIFLPFIALGLDYVRYPLNQQLYLLWFPLAFIAIPTLFACFNKSRTDRLIGELSYPCYLMHGHVLIFTSTFFQNPKNYWARGPLSFAITLTACVLFYWFIESKTERFREGLYRKSHPKDYIQPPASRAAENPASSLN